MPEEATDNADATASQPAPEPQPQARRRVDPGPIEIDTVLKNIVPEVIKRIGRNDSGGQEDTGSDG